MRRTSILNLSAILVFLSVVSAPMAADAQDSDRRAMILSNLKEQTNLATMEVDIVKLEASPYGGLDQGSLLVRSPNGLVELSFLVSQDNKQFFLINGQPIDVSQDPDANRLERAELIAKAAGSRPQKGNPAGAQVVAEFSDFQCPYCAGAVEPLDAVVKQRQDAMVVFFHLPIESIHPWAKPAAIATECAFQQSQEAFWTLHDGFFAQQGSITPENVAPVALGLLADSGIDVSRWQGCFSGEDAASHAEANARIQSDVELATELSVQSTPTIFVNGVRFRGAMPVETLIGAMK